MGDDNIHLLTREEGVVTEEFCSHYSRTKLILHLVKLHLNEASRVHAYSSGKTNEQQQDGFLQGISLLASNYSDIK